MSDQVPGQLPLFEGFEISIDPANGAVSGRRIPAQRALFECGFCHDQVSAGHTCAAMTPAACDALMKKVWG